MELAGSTFEARPTAAGQVGLFPEHATLVPWLHGALADRDAPTILNLFAYTGLVTLAEGISSSQTVPGSEPRVGVRESRRNKQLYPLTSLFPVVEQLAPVASFGLADTAASVRRLCAAALRIAAEALAFEVRHLPSIHVFYSERVPWFECGDALPKRGGTTGFEPID